MLRGLIAEPAVDIALSPDLERQIAETLETGRYASASEVISEGLRLLFAADLTRADRLARLREDIQIGLDQLDRGDSVDGATALKEVNARLARR